MGLLLGDILRRNAATVPYKTAYVLRSGGDRIAVSYAEFDRRANQLANAFARMEIGRGERVGILMRNNAHYPVVYFALLKLGAVAIPLNFRYRAAELREVLGHALPKLLVVEDETEQLARESISGAVMHLVTTGAGAADMASIEALMEGASPDEPHAELHETDPFALLYTSGTTGASKGVVQTHRAYHLQTGQPVFSSRGTGEDDVGLCMFQLFHSSGWRTSLIYWRARATVVITRDADPRQLLQAIEQERVTQFMGLPETLRKVCDLAERERFDLSSFQHLNTGTSTISPEDARRFASCFGVRGIRVHYGSSESGPVSTLSAEESLSRPTSIGRPAAQVDVKLVDESGEAVAVGEVGELCVRSEFLMDGYNGDPEQTARVLQDGWYHSGDLARADAEGYLGIVGRVGERIRSGGESIYPAEVERVIAELAGVAECAVLGVPDPEWGEVVLAVIVPAADGAPEPDAVVAHCREVLAAYKCPRHVRLVRSLPKTAATDKVRKIPLKQSFLAGEL